MIVRFLSLERKGGGQGPQGTPGQFWAERQERKEKPAAVDSEVVKPGRASGAGMPHRRKLGLRQ